MNADGTFDYDPNGQFNALPGPASGASNLTGEDSFTYTLAGGGAATVTITISGEDSDGDVLEGTPGDDALAGGIGSDTYYVENSTDTVTELVGEGDADRAIASTHFTLAAGQEIEFLETSDADGTAAINLRGNALQQTIEGNDGNNILHDGGTGPLPDDGVPDTLIGHGGDDTYIVYDPEAVIVEVAGEGSDRVAAGVNYVLQPDVSVEYLNTTSLRATYAVNLTGNNLVQWMRGNDGANVLDGGGGSDNIFGMGGADTFRFSTDLAPDNIDRIRDFNVADDTIQLDSAIFTELAPGALAASAFKDVFLAAKDADDRIIYNSNTGGLFYDHDGAGGDAAVKFARLEVADGLGLSAADFVVI
jgi:Ca2+-binding RTX toxin-like protein